MLEDDYNLFYTVSGKFKQLNCFQLYCQILCGMHLEKTPLNYSKNVTEIILRENCTECSSIDFL